MYSSSLEQFFYNKYINNGTIHFPPSHFRFASAMGYFGLSLNNNHIGGNFYVNVTLTEAVTFASSAMMLTIHKFGRKGPYVFAMLLGGVACLAVVAVDILMKGELSLRSLSSGNQSINISVVLLEFSGPYFKNASFFLNQFHLSRGFMSSDYYLEYLRLYVFLRKSPN